MVVQEVSNSSPQKIRFASQYTPAVSAECFLSSARSWVKLLTRVDPVADTCAVGDGGVDSALLWYVVVYGRWLRGSDWSRRRGGDGKRVA